MKGRLVKWDAAMVGEEPPQLDDPATHPGCIEIIDINEGELPKVIYRRHDDAIDDSGRTIPG